MSERFLVEMGGDRPDVAVWDTDKFKTLTVRVAFLRPLGPGMAADALLAEVLRRGTRRLPERAEFFARLQELYGADVRGETGRIGARGVLSFQLEVPAERFLPEQGVEEEALALLGDVLLDPRLEDGRFPAHWLAEEAANQLRQLDALVNDKAQYAHLRLLELMYPGDPYAWPRQGRREDILALTPEALGRHYLRLFEESPAVVYAVGHKAGEAARRMAASLAGRVRGGFLKPLAPPEPSQGPAKEAEEHQAVTQAKLAIGYRSRASAFTPQATALSLMTGILGGYSHSKLFQNVREKASLAYYAYARLDAFKGAVYIHSGIDPSQVAAARAIITRQVEDMAAGRFSDEEWEMTVRAMANQIRAGEDSAARMIDAHLELSLAGRPTGIEERVAALAAVERREIEDVAQGLRLDAVFFLADGGVS